jgi:hypothetical protein
MISTMRPDIDNADEYVRNTTARAFAVIASALGIPVRAQWFGPPSPQRNLQPLFFYTILAAFARQLYFHSPAFFEERWLTRADPP